MSRNKSIEIIKLQSTESKHFYTTEKNKKNKPEKMELMKYDPIVRKHVLYTEKKIGK